MSDAKTRSLATLAALAAAVISALTFVFWAKSVYNELVEQDEKVRTAWSQVENQYQRRADLVPNLVGLVKGYMEHERGTLENVIKARTKAVGAAPDASRLDEASLQNFQTAQGELAGALSRLMAVAENYPELKAGESFRELQVQLEGTENRIAVERKRFNETVQRYNTSLRRFPASLLAGFFHFQARAYFEADQGAEKAPPVDFSGAKQ